MKRRALRRAEKRAAEAVASQVEERVTIGAQNIAREYTRRFRRTLTEIEGVVGLICWLHTWREHECARFGCPGEGADY